MGALRRMFGPHALPVNTPQTASQPISLLRFSLLQFPSTTGLSVPRALTPRLRGAPSRCHSPASALSHSVVTRWRADPFACGSYSYLKRGSGPAHTRALAAPEAGGRLLFAGEACSVSAAQCVHGAVQSWAVAIPPSGGAHWCLVGSTGLSVWPCRSV